MQMLDALLMMYIDIPGKMDPGVRNQNGCECGANVHLRRHECQM